MQGLRFMVSCASPDVSQGTSQDAKEWFGPLFELGGVWLWCHQPSVWENSSSVVE